MQSNLQGMILVGLQETEIVSHSLNLYARFQTDFIIIRWRKGEFICLKFRIMLKESSLADTMNEEQMLRRFALARMKCWKNWNLNLKRNQFEKDFATKI